MCFCCCCANDAHETKAVDICVIFEECDQEAVQPLLSTLKFNRADGSKLQVFPPRKSSCSYDDAMRALEHAHAILLVLSDKACVALQDEDAEKSNFYKLIEKACERERQNLSRILPLFLYETINEEENVGLVRFSSWAFKCKNENARAYMEHIGSLQGVFSDPAEWESKFEKILSFWQEAHNALVPLTWNNVQQELDCGQIRATYSGACLGCCCSSISLILVCIPGGSCCGSRWMHFRKGVLAGNVVIMLVIAVFFLSYGIYFHDSNCRTYECEQLAQYVKNVLLIIGLVFAITGFFMTVACIGLQREEKTLKAKLMEEGQL